MKQNKNLLTLINIVLAVAVAGSAAWVAKDVFSMSGNNNGSDNGTSNNMQVASNSNTIKSFSSKIVPAPSSEKPQNKKVARARTSKKQKKLELIGIVSYNEKPDTSVALFSVQGGQDTAVKVGEDIDGGRILDSVEADGAMIKQDGLLEKKSLSEDHKGSGAGTIGQPGMGVDPFGAPAAQGNIDPFPAGINQQDELMRLEQQRRNMEAYIPGVAEGTPGAIGPEGVPPDQLAPPMAIPDTIPTEQNMY